MQPSALARERMGRSVFFANTVHTAAIGRLLIGGP